MFVISIIIFAILMFRIKIEFFLNEDLTIFLKILGFKKQLYPEKLKRFPVRKFKKGYPQAKKKISLVKESIKHSISVDEKISKESSDTIGDKVYSVVYFYKLFFSAFFKHLRLDISKINIIVGGKDAASAAINYGVISQSVAYLLGFLDDNLKIHKRHNGNVTVLCDFTSRETVYDIFISSSINILQIIDIIKSIVYNYVNKMIQYDSQNQINKGDQNNARK